MATTPEPTAQDRKLADVQEYWLVSAPGEKTCAQTWETLNATLSKHNNLSYNFKFHIPELKVGTLDTLVGMTEELAKLDGYVESIVRKLSQYMADVLEDERDKLKENMLVNGMGLGQYITRFQWDMAKYPTKQPLKNIEDIIAKQVTQIDQDLKSKASAYNGIKGNLQNLERKATGSLMTRNLADIVNKDDVVVGSEYLATLFVVVPGAGYKDWWGRYETLSDMVVPGSSKMVFEDNEHGLFTVTLFRRVIDEYKLHCRENKFVVRDFQYNEEEVAAGKTELNRLTNDKKKQFGPLVRWLKVNFAEAFIAWAHVKALRVYVESVLRYGLPVNFQAMVLAPGKKMQKRLREELHRLYAHLDTSGTVDLKSEVVEIPGLNMNASEYFPYVYFKINVDMVEHIK